MQSIVTAIFAALLGLLGFVAGQIILRLIEPALEFRAFIGSIARDLILYANHDPSIADNLTRLKLFREHASAIHEKLYKIVYYDQLRCLFQLPARKDAEAASAELVGLSNLQVSESRHSLDYNPWERMENIRRLLQIKKPSEPSEPALKRKLAIPKIEDVVDPGDSSI